MAMRIELTKKEGVELITKDKFCKDNVKVELDDDSRAALVPENIRSGAKILDVEGVYETPTEKRSVDLALADGNQVVEASSGKVMTSVVIVKPPTLQPENIKLGVTIAGVLGNHETDLTVEFAEQDALLSEIEALLDGSGEDSGDGESATLTVDFAYEYEEEVYDEESGDYDYIMTNEPSTASGSYTVDGGASISFSDVETLSIEGLSVGSVVKISVDILWDMSGEYSTDDEVGCVGDFLCDSAHDGEDNDYEGEFGGCREGVKITITEPTASVTVYECFA